MKGFYGLMATFFSLSICSGVFLGFVGYAYATDSQILKELQNIQKEVKQAKEQTKKSGGPAEPDSKKAENKASAWTKIKPRKIPKSEKSIEEEAEEILGGITTRVRKKPQKKSRKPAGDLEKEILQEETSIPEELRRAKEASPNPSADIIDSGLDAGDDKNRE